MVLPLLLSGLFLSGRARRVGNAANVSRSGSVLTGLSTFASGALKALTSTTSLLISGVLGIGYLVISSNK